MLYLVIIGLERLQALLHDVIAIRILDELQEAGAQSRDDELNLLPCPQALNQLLHRPCPETKTITTKISNQKTKLRTTKLPKSETKSI